ncbi:MAG: hypothetical protein ACI8UO_004112 [Verrucomicrobiales bacterium]|jgi:hypothetical protein
MNSSVLAALKCGLILGLANLAWLYVAYWIGLRTNGILVIQIYTAIWLIMNIAGVIIGLLKVRRVSKKWSYAHGLGSGLLIGVASAVLAAFAQVGYWELIHPEWPAVMAEQIREIYEMDDLPEAEIEASVEKAAAGFTMANFIRGSIMEALMITLIVGSIAMIFIQRPFSEPEAAE